MTLIPRPPMGAVDTVIRSLRWIGCGLSRARTARVGAENDCETTGDSGLKSKEYTALNACRVHQSPIELMHVIIRKEIPHVGSQLRITGTQP